MLESEISDIGNCADQPLVIDDLPVLFPLGAHEREDLLVVELLEPKQLIIVFELLAYA